MATLAIATPALLAFNLPPSATFLNQALALAGWAAFLLVITALLPARLPTVLIAGATVGGPRGLAALIAVFGVLGLAALASPLWTGLPWSLALSGLGLIGAATLVALAAAAAQHAGAGTLAFRAFCIGLVVAGVASSVIGLVQVFAPEWTGSTWIAGTALEGRAVGNLRQPNHLSSLLLWSLIAAAWLTDVRVLPRAAGAALALLMVFVLLLSGSRTGLVGTAVLFLWGALDTRLARSTRLMLLLAPVLYGLCWAGMAGWAHSHEQVFGGEAQWHKGDLSSSRFAIWGNTLSLIAAHPWFGVGYGEFNFAWTLTPFPGRPVAFFDHTHNLLLQFAVELGVPLAALLMALLLYALWAALRAVWRLDGIGASAQRAALVMVLMVALHSQLEYPLWYAYFLLPAAFAFGLCLGGTAAPASAGPASEPGRTRPLLVASLWLLMGAMYAIYDYQRVVVIFAPPEGAAPLAERVAAGHGSSFFSHHADYAAATTATHPSTVLGAFDGATHYLLDVRLMMAWATALNEAGEVQLARHVAQRLKEFRNPGAAEFFAPCDTAQQAGVERPFQCAAPTQALDYRDFR